MTLPPSGRENLMALLTKCPNTWTQRETMARSDKVCVLRMEWSRVRLLCMASVDTASNSETVISTTARFNLNPDLSSLNPHLSTRHLQAMQAVTPETLTPDS
eukprot:3625027-Rhodomonas_salina.1